MKNFKNAIVIFVLLTNLSLYAQQNFSERLFYDSGKYKLKADHKTGIDKLILKIDLNKVISIEINSNTDSIGTDIFNYELARKRSDELYDYLISKNVPFNIISIMNSGERNPIDPNNQKLNRRVDITISVPDDENDIFEKVVQNENSQINNFYDSLSGKEQKFTIKNNKDTTIVGMQGTIIVIPGNSFLTTNNADIEITLKEVYEMSDKIRKMVK